MRARSILASAAALTWMIACGIEEGGVVTPLGDAADLTDGAPSDARQSFDGGDSSLPRDAAPSDASDAAPLCPAGLQGPPLVWVPGTTYCIDSTEVTNAEFDKYRQAYDASSPPSGCSWISKNGPSGSLLVAGNDNDPVVQVHWCDAYLYCQWAGKHLCGKRGGGGLPLDNVTTASTSEWYNACSDGGQNPYPYGSPYVEANCNTNNQVGNTVPVGSFTQCVGAPAGVYDMSGNVREWINACDGTTSNNDNCQIMSGDYGNQPNGERCDMFDHIHRDESGQDWIGFRCCWGK